MNCDESAGITDTGKWRIQTIQELEEARGEKTRAEVALRESEARFRALFESSPNGIFLTDPETLEILDCNATACAMNGYAREELLGRSINVLHPDEVQARMETEGGRARFVEQLRRDGPITVESIHRRRDGTLFPMETSMCLLEAGGRSVVMGIDRDITERKKTEEELTRYREGLEEVVATRTAELAEARDRAEAADRLKSAFLATMSHELRTPLNSIIGFTTLLHEELAGPLNPEQRKQLGWVKSSSVHLLELVNGVLDISRIEAGQLEVRPVPFDPGASLRRCVEQVSPAATAKGLALALEVAPGVGTFESDPRRFEQVVLNLLGNAVKFTESGGITVRCAVEADSLVTSVADTGIGIAPEDGERLFRLFRQLDAGLSRRYEGMGLGLAICRGLLALLGGEIAYESEPGRGSVFTFRLPLRQGGTE